MASGGHDTNTHNWRPNYERCAGDAGGAGSSRAPNPSGLDAALEGLRTPVVLNANLDTQSGDLEAACQHILDEAEAVAAVKRRLETTLREYNVAHGFTPESDLPGRRGSRGRGRKAAPSPSPGEEPPAKWGRG